MSAMPDASLERTPDRLSTTCCAAATAGVGGVGAAMGRIMRSRGRYRPGRQPTAVAVCCYSPAVLEFILAALTAPIRLGITLLLLFLATLAVAFPSLLGRGVAALGRGMVTLLLPKRRTAWLRGRRATREGKRKVHADVALMMQETAEYGREEAQRRSLARMQAETDARMEARRAARKTTDPS